MDSFSSYVVYGAGGHAMVLADLIKQNGGEVRCFFDDNPPRPLIMENVPALPYQASRFKEAKLLLGIGNNKVREKLALETTHQYGILVHPSASVAPGVKLGPGTVVLANAIVQANATIGEHVIINAGACVDHDAVVEDFVHVAPLAYIGGGAVIRKGAVIGAGAVVMRNMVVEADTDIPPLSRVE